jgi:hypothetical protein
VWTGPQGHSAAATIGADPASATSRQGAARSSRPPRARHPARGRATRGRAERDDRDGRALLKRLLALRPDPVTSNRSHILRGGGRAGSLITRRDARVRPARADAVDRRRGLNRRLREPGQAGKRGQVTRAKAPVDELVTGIDPTALLYLDRPLADATVVGDPIELQPVTRGAPPHRDRGELRRTPRRCRADRNPGCFEPPAPRAAPTARTTARRHERASQTTLGRHPLGTTCGRLGRLSGRYRIEAAGAAPADRCRRPRAHGRRSASLLHGAPASQCPLDGKRTWHRLTRRARRSGQALQCQRRRAGGHAESLPPALQEVISCISTPTPCDGTKNDVLARSVGVLTTRFSGMQQPQAALSRQKQQLASRAHHTACTSGLAARGSRSCACRPDSGRAGRTG